MDVRKQINLLAASVGIEAHVVVCPRGDHCVTASVGRYDHAYPVTTQGIWRANVGACALDAAVRQSRARSA
jgi:hypothetical protein